MLSTLARFSLRTKLVVLAFGVVVGVSGILLVSLPRAMDAQSRGWLTSRSLGLGRLLASSVEAAIDFEDIGAAQLALDGLQHTRGPVYALLLRADGTSFARWSRAGVPVEPPADEGATFSGRLLHVRVPWTTRAGRAATLLLGFSLDELEERRAEARASVLRATALAMVAGLLGAILLGSLLVRPLRVMTAAAQGVAAGDESAARGLPVGRADEIGALAHAFTRMLERLWEQRAQIHTINADLAQRVQERTQELARTHDALAALARTQEQLVLADRRVSVGRLAAGVAHEVNNPLTFLLGNLDFLGSEIPRTQGALRRGDLPEAQRILAEMAGALADVQQGAQRVGHIVRGLKTFSRDDDDRREVLDLREPLEAAVEMALHEIKHRAQLVRRFEPAPRVLGNEVRLSQVFLNLLLNAAQAIPEGSAQRHQIRVLVGTDGRGRAVASIEDTGCGIPGEVRARIFDPFFTTKPVGVGSGLGLSISRNIVEGLGGEIEVESEPGRGTTFRVALPPAAREPGPEPRPPPPAAEAEAAVSLHGIRVLVVDDEPLVGMTLRRALLDAEVTVVSSGREAIDRITRGETFDRILCDVMMPGMNGPELHQEIGRIAPHLQGHVLFMTGGAFTDGAVDFVQEWRGPLLHKPFKTAVLRRLLHAPIP